MLMGMSDADPVGPEIGRLLASAHKRAARAFAQALEPLDLDGRLFGVMTALARLGPVTQARLIVELDSDKSAMLRTVDDLERRGLAVRQAVPGDRRARTVALTPAGRQQLAASAEVAHRVASDLFGAMTATERAALRDLLDLFVRGRTDRLATQT
jgi:DNA-binding MarR family transcriptional regulator